MKFLVTLVGSLMLAACGGSGGSDPMPPAQTTPTISASPSTVTSRAIVTDAAPTANVSLTFANAPSNVFLSVDDTTTNGISSVGTPTYDSTKGSFTISFKSPANLKPADYSDTLTVLLCSDAQCKVVLASQPLQVTYTVEAATGSTAPSVTLDSTTQSHSALYYQGVPSPNVNLDPAAFTFANFPAAPNVQVSAPTNAAIGAVAFAMQDATHGGIVLTFAAPSSLAQNTYTTPVTVNVCIDPNCVNVVQTFTVTVSYIVTNKITADGDNGYTIAAYPIAARLLAANVNLTSVLALVPAAAPATVNSIQAVDPATGNVTATLALSESPNQALALADDGSYLYVNGPTQVEQVQVAPLSAGVAIPAPDGVNTSIAVQPGHPQTIALGYTNLKMFDGATARAHVLSNPPYVYESLAWTGNPAVLAGRQLGNTVELECGFAVNASGFDTSATPACVSSFAGSSAAQTFVFSGGFGYGSGGSILRESDWTTITSLPTTAPRTLSNVLPDSQANRAFAFYSVPDGSSCSLQSFALPANTAVANIPLPQGIHACPYDHLVRWGPNGLAFTTGTDLVVVTGKFVAP